MLKIIRSFPFKSRINWEENYYNLKQCKRHAGHSKWANIKHIKGSKDAQKAQTFQKMSRLIRLAIQEGGNADPNFNVQLANTIAQAKRHNMPQVSIQNALKQAQVPKTNAKAGQYEIRGPGGCTIIVCTLTDNPARVRATLNTIVRKANSSFVDGAIGGLFHHKGVIKASPPENTSLETAVDHAIEVGAEDVAEVDSLEDRVLQFLCEASLLHRVRGKLEKLQYSIKTAECEFIALHHVALSDADLEAVGKLYNKLEEDPDVVQLFDNIV